MRNLFSPIKIFLLFILNVQVGNAQAPSDFRIIGYYAGDTTSIDSFETGKLSHIIFSFGHLCGNKFCLSNAADTVIIRKMVAQKAHFPNLKVMLSLGGWGGCETCSEVFSSANGRNEFARSVQEISTYLHTDGIDLDWEYPSIKGFPGHKFSMQDKENFTELIKELRRANQKDFQISFASGGFTQYIDDAVSWKDVTPYVDFINVMTYDLVHGFSKESGHHTPLFSTAKQIESTDHAVNMLLNKGVPADKIVIGAAFYGRYFEIEEGSPVDLYMPAHFLHGFSFKNSRDSLSVANGFEAKWDKVAQAPYAINKKRRLVATYDDAKSIRLKTKYA